MLLLLLRTAGRFGIMAGEAEFRENLRIAGFFKDVVEKFEDAMIDAHLLMMMTEGDFKEMELPLAHRIRLRAFQRALRRRMTHQVR